MTKPVLIFGEVSDGLVRMLAAMGFDPERVTEPSTAQTHDAVLVICATEDERSGLEQRFPAVAGKTLAGGSPLQVVTRFQPDRGATGPPTKLGLVGAVDMPDALLSRLRHSGRFEVRMSPDASDDSVAAVTELSEWADVVLWTGERTDTDQPARSGQRTIIHVGHDVADDWVSTTGAPPDAVVVPTPHIGGRIIEVAGWPREIIHVVPRLVDDFQFARTKHPEARFNLGMVNASIQSKRLDLALDLLARLRLDDRRYRLFVKGPFPWESEDHSEYFDELRRRLDGDPVLWSGVIFDPPGPDIASWLRGIGFILSTSESETFHLSVAEGMASGAVPLIRPWPGATGVYDQRWLVEPDEMPNRVLETNVSEKTWISAGRTAQAEVVDKYAFDVVAQQWMGLLTGSP